MKEENNENYRFTRQTKYLSCGAPTSKSEALDQMVELMAKSGKIDDTEAYRKSRVCKRGRKHHRYRRSDLPSLMENVTQSTLPGLAAMVVKDGVDFDALDGAPVSPDLPDRRSKHGRQCASGRIK